MSPASAEVDSPLSPVRLLAQRIAADRPIFTAFDLLVKQLEKTAWPNLLCRFSSLCTDGGPVEFTFSSKDDRFRFTIEVAGPEFAEASRLDAACESLTDLGLPLPPAHLAAEWRAMQSQATLRWGTWLGMRQQGNGYGAKLYIEVPRGHFPAGQRPIIPGSVLHMIGYDLRTGVAEHYFRVDGIDAAGHRALLHTFREHEHWPQLLEDFSDLWGMPGEAALRWKTFGYSLRQGSDARAAGGLTLFAHVASLRGPGVVRDAMCRAMGAERSRVSTYMSLLANLSGDQVPAHGVAAVAVNASGETELRCDMSALGLAKAVSSTAVRTNRAKSTSPASSNLPTSAQDQRVAAIYRDDYAEAYPSLYLKPWQGKHQLNVRKITAILETLPNPMPDWLDLACGQGWHFSQFQGRARMVGLDLSSAQLHRARAQAPLACFIQKNMADGTFEPESFDLVTNFWAGYCYLGTEARIASLLHKAVSWIRPGGALYMEVLLADDLMAFNQSQFAGQKGFAVKLDPEDPTGWRYEDIGGCHHMKSPPLDWFIELLTPAFSTVEAWHDRGFMVHVIASGKKGPTAAASSVLGPDRQDEAI